MPTKLLVTGSTGQLGQEFCNFKSDKFEIVGINRTDADVTDLDQVRNIIDKHKPDIVIHTAAMTDVDACETNSELARIINAVGARNVAMAAKEANAAIVYFSTDYVFDGKKGSPYVESDVTSAKSYYGIWKWAGEMATEEFNEQHTIIRTSWVYSQYRKNFVKAIIRQALEGNTIRVVNDQFGSPTWTKDIVRQTVKIIENKQAHLFHVASKGKVSRYEMAKFILQKLNLDAEIQPITTKDANRPAERPINSELSSERLSGLGIDKMRPYNEALDEFLEQYGEQLINEIKN